MFDFGISMFKILINALFYQETDYETKAQKTCFSNSLFQETDFSGSKVFHAISHEFRGNMIEVLCQRRRLQILVALLREISS